ncbi:MAG TPA: TIM barrel protein, partial [Lacipirellulaceae bacterium]|nr:TIM barrel protein [Lacipirellulaceae bacterium]
MAHVADRRAFIRSSLAAVAGAATVRVAETPAIEPIARPTGSHFKFSLAAYSYRDLLKGKSPKLKIDNSLDECAKFDLDGAEITAYYLPQNGPDEYFRKLKAGAFRRGLDVSGTAVGNDFCFPAGKERDQQIAHVKQWIEYADMMDAPVIRIFSGTAKPGQSAEVA